MLFSCSRANEQSRVLGEEVNAESKENVCLKRRKEDFGEAMRLFPMASKSFGHKISRNS
jgi:hypothetical protein